MSNRNHRSVQHAVAARSPQATVASQDDAGQSPGKILALLWGLPALVIVAAVVIKAVQG